MKKTLAPLLALALCASLLVVPAGAAEFTRGKTYTPGQFTDVPDSAWYAASVKDCFELGLMSGSSADAFNPAGTFTLAEAATIAARMHNLYTGGNGIMPPSTGAWYQSAVDYCVKNGIFGAEEFNDFTRSATRAEMAGIMASALPDSAWEAKNSVTALPDVNRATSYADAIFKLYDAGVFTGSDDYGMFQPYAGITRAEVAAIAARCADQSQRKTLVLKPLTQQEAPVIPGGQFGGAISYRLLDEADPGREITGHRDDENISAMSSGRLRFQDPNTQKWGFLDGNGQAVIPAIYEEADHFELGYAMVKKDGKWGAIDTAGQVTLPFAYNTVTSGQCTETSQFLPAGYYIVGGPEGAGLVKNGRLISSLYANMTPVGDGLIATHVMVGDQNYCYGMIDLTGREIMPCKYRYFTNNHNGLYGNNHFSCQAYDSIPYVFGFALSNETGQSGPDHYHQLTVTIYSEQGQELGTTENKYTSRDDTKRINSKKTKIRRYGKLKATFCGFSVAKNNPLYGQRVNNKWVVGNQTGPFTEAIYDSVNCVEDSEFAVTHYGSLTGLVGTAGEIFAPGVYDGFNPKGKYVIVEKDDKVVGVADATGMLPGSVEDYFPAEKDEPVADNSKTNHYAIRNNDAGKPIVAYGNDADGWTPVIEFYKNNMYYDWIQDLGEGYYACCYNTTWYLLHVN